MTLTPAQQSNRIGVSSLFLQQYALYTVNARRLRHTCIEYDYNLIWKYRAIWWWWWLACCWQPVKSVADWRTQVGTCARFPICAQARQYHMPSFVVLCKIKCSLGRNSICTRAHSAPQQNNISIYCVFAFGVKIMKPENQNTFTWTPNVHNIYTSCLSIVLFIGAWCGGTIWAVCCAPENEF